MTRDHQLFSGSAIPIEHIPLPRETAKDLKDLMRVSRFLMRVRRSVACVGGL